MLQPSIFLPKKWGLRGERATPRLAGKHIRPVCYQSSLDEIQHDDMKLCVRTARLGRIRRVVVVRQLEKVQTAYHGEESEILLHYTNTIREHQGWGLEEQMERNH